MFYSATFYLLGYKVSSVQDCVQDCHPRTQLVGWGFLRPRQLTVTGITMSCSLTALRGVQPAPISAPTQGADRPSPQTTVVLDGGREALENL